MSVWPHQLLDACAPIRLTRKSDFGRAFAASSSTDFAFGASSRSAHSSSISFARRQSSLSRLMAASTRTMRATMSAPHGWRRKATASSASGTMTCSETPTASWRLCFARSARLTPHPNPPPQGGREHDFVSFSFLRAFVVKSSFRVAAVKLPPHAQAHRPQIDPDHRCRADRDRPGLRVRLFGRAGLQGAEGRGLSRHPGRIRTRPRS